MILKIKHISTRFLIQSLFTILIIATLIFIMFYSGSRKKDTLDVKASLSEIQTALIITELAFEEAMAEANTDPQFTTQGADALISKHQVLFNDITSEFKHLEEYNFLKKVLLGSSLDDSLLQQSEAFSGLFINTILSLKERGNKYGGVVEKAVAEMDAVAAELEMAPDNGLQASRFQAFSSAYLVQLSYQSLNDLINSLDGILSELYFIEGYDFSYLEEKIGQLRNTLNYIKRIETRLYNPETKSGQVVNSKLTLTNLESQFALFDKMLLNRINQYHLWWNWVFTILAVLLTVAYVVVMGLFSRTVVSSVRNLHKVTLDLSVGKISSAIKNVGKYEFKDFNNDLKALFSLLKSRKEFIDNLLQDNYNAELEVKGDQDVIGASLHQLREKMKSAQQEQLKYETENKARRYMNEGLAKFADIMRKNSHDINLLSDEFIKNFVKYMNALQGGLYIANEDDPDTLTLTAAFAYERKRFLEKTIKKGEGLIGTCYVEKKTINIDKLPDGYIIIKSGLGDTPPNHLLLLPVMNEKVPVGVIEIASLEAFTPTEIDLAEKIAESLAATLISSRVNSKTADLLRKSQEQAAEMAEQEEEMRQNMEELQATQEESSRREEEMQGIINAIGQSFYVIEYDLNSKICHVNDRLLGFLDQPIELVLFKEHQEIFSKASKIDKNKILEIIQSKQPQKIDETLSWGSEELDYSHSISPVFDSSGEVIKVLNLFSIATKKTDN